ncbi:hypothetical protein GCM10017687_21070 [Streptomyces echinatus]
MWENAANSSAYCLRTAFSMAAARSVPIPAHSRAPNSRASANRRAVRSSTMRSAFSVPKRSGKIPARVVGVVEEEDEVAQADQGVGAFAGPGQVTGVAVHVADHVDAGPPAAGACECHGDQG